MSTDGLQQAFDSTRGVLAVVEKGQLGDATPCAKWDVRALVNHIVGGAHWFAACVNDGSSDDSGDDLPNFASDDFLATFDEGTKAAVAAFGADGAMEKMLKLPFGTFPGAAFLGRKV